MNTLQETALTLQQDWDIALPDTLSEQAILEKLAERVAALIARGPEPFFQLMYRLDISEKKLNNVMFEPDVAYKIAKLIYDRQWQKIESRAHFNAHATDTDPDLKW